MRIKFPTSNQDQFHKYLSECLTVEEIETWLPGEIIMIVANTGCGKSHFIKNVLRDYLKSQGQNCLYLLSRVRTKEQFEAELPDDDTIKFATYQTIESLVINTHPSIDNYDFIIADECHYFLDDSSFNNRTDISLDWILGQNQATRILMTATGDGIEEYLNEQKLMFTQYRLTGNYDQIRNLSFFWHEDQLPLLAEQIIASGNKGIFFIQSAAKAYNLYQEFKDDGMFLCSSHNKDYAKYMDDTAVINLLEDTHFDCSILFATTALDTGTNIKDKNLTSIVIDVTEPVKIIQCLGRKRFVSEDDFVDVYIRGRSNMQLGGMIKKLHERAEIVHDFIKRGAVSYNNANGRNNDGTGLIFDALEDCDGDTPLFSKRINKLKYAQIRQDIKTYREMLNMGDYGYIKYIARLLGKDEYAILEDEREQKSLTEYLEKLVGVPLLTQAEKEPLIQILNVRQNRHLCKSFNTLAGWFEDSKLPYRLHKYSTSRMVDGKKKNYTAWELVKLNFS